MPQHNAKLNEKCVTAALKGGVRTRHQAKQLSEEQAGKDDVNSLVEEMSGLNINRMKTKLSRTTKMSKDEGAIADAGVRHSVPIGLENPGNMCYLNSVLQGLSFSPAFSDWALEVAAKKIGRWKKDQDAVLAVSLLTDIEHIMERSYAASGRKTLHGSALMDLDSHQTVHDMDPDIGFGGSGQQDAHEFTQLVFISLQHLEGLCTPKRKTKKTQSGTTLDETITGTTYMTRKCTVCKGVVTTEDEWNILTLHVSSTNDSLSECFENIAEKQTLDDDDMVFCEKCKKKTKSVQQSRLSSAGSMVVVHLNLSIRRKSSTVKLQRTVGIPTSHELKLYSPAKRRYRKDAYELTAVVMHRGASTHSGHYTVYVRGEDGEWFLCNDEHVSRVQQDRLPFLHSKKKATLNPYLLFFSKV